MKTLNLHTQGETYYLEILKRELKSLVQKIKKDTTLSKEEKQEKIDTLKKEHTDKKKQILKKLF